jgi:predicted GH43/DUF377 family glycosyl hydrolase
VGVAVTQDFRSMQKHPVTTFNAKAMALFPERVDGKMAAILTARTDIPPAFVGIAILDREEQLWSSEYWDEWYGTLEDHVLLLQREPTDHVEVGAPPVLTDEGWLLLYCHIRDYGRPDRQFGVEAVLLDRDDPFKILGRTNRPLLFPEEPYELYGRVPNTIFPSGALVREGSVHLYYGAADTSCCLATCDLRLLLAEIKTDSICFERFAGNPIVSPDATHPWEAWGTFNAGALYAKERVHLLYRAVNVEGASVLGYASTRDGMHIDERLAEPAYVPREPFEQPAEPGVAHGCEDPRLTRIDETVHMCYTAYDGVGPPRVALTTIDLADFLARRWAWSRPRLVSKPGEMNKDAALFPRKIGGKYVMLHRPGTSIWIDFLDHLELGNGRWLGGTVLLEPPSGAPKIGGGAPPIETAEGWLLLYHGISSRPGRHYHMKAALLDLEDPRKVRANMTYPCLDPLALYERVGLVPNVVFSCGAVVLGDRLFMYYGGADRVLAVATLPLLELVKRLMAEHVA